MKTTHRSLRLAGILALLACLAAGRVAAQPGATPANSAITDGGPAVAAFKAEVENVGKWIEEKQKTVTTDPTQGIAMVGEIIAKIRGIKTDGLPADLKAAWSEMNVVLGEMGEVFKAMPKVDASKPEETGKVMQEFLPKMMTIQAKVEPAAKKLQEIGIKYGIDMKKVAPGK